MTDYQRLEKEIVGLRSEFATFVSAFEKWKKTTDIGLKGDDDHGTWGYRQKIDYNRKKISHNEKKIESVDGKVNKVIYMAIGAGSVAGLAATIIFNIIQML